MSAARDLVRAAAAAGVTLEARLWCDAPDRLAPELREALAGARPAVLRLLLDGQKEGEAVADRGMGEPAGLPTAPAPSSPDPDDDPALHAVAVRLDAALIEGYRRAALRRPPSLPIEAPPGAGCTCTLCGGQRWWCERVEPSGWRCRTCYPPDHLPAEDVRELRT